MLSFDFKIPHEHTCLEGHFPGNPIVPGVVIIDELMRGILQWDVSINIIGISSIKFIKPVEPGVSVNVKVTKKLPRALNFTCTIDGEMIVIGQFSTEEVLEL